MKVTSTSNYEDSVWDFFDEIKVAGKTKWEARVRFESEIYQQNPILRDQVKDYIWKRRCATTTHKVASWTTLAAAERLIRRFATVMIELGVDDFSKLTERNASAVIKRLPNVLSTRNVLEQVRLLTGILNKGANPLRQINIPRTITNKCTQSKRISDEDMRKLVAHALTLGERVGAYIRLKRSQDFTSKEAKLLKAYHQRGLKMAGALIEVAGAVLILAGVGLRRSELLSLKADCLECNKGIWYINGTVFKFYGDGVPAKWQCGELGKLGVDILRKLGNDKLCTLDIYALSKCLKRFGAAAGIENPDSLHPHRFRRTFAVKSIEHISEEVLKDHFKHKCIEMTDYYVGNDAELYETLTKGKNSLEEFAKFLAEEADFDISDL